MSFEGVKTTPSGLNLMVALEAENLQSCHSQSSFRWKGKRRLIENYVKIVKECQKTIPTQRGKKKEGKHKRQEKNKNTNDSAFNPLSQPRRHVVPTKCIWWSTHFSSHGNSVASRTHYVRLTLVWGISATEPDSEKMKIWSHHKNWSWFQAFNLFFSSARKLGKWSNLVLILFKYVFPNGELGAYFHLEFPMPHEQKQLMGSWLHFTSVGVFIRCYSWELPHIL